MFCEEQLRQGREKGLTFYDSPLQRDFDKLLPTARFTQALDEAEELAKRLDERYMICVSFCINHHK